MRDAPDNRVDREGKFSLDSGETTKSSGFQVTAGRQRPKSRLGQCSKVTPRESSEVEDSLDLLLLRDVTFMATF